MTTASTLTLPAYADEFLLRRDITFLNHGSFGACPRPVFNVYQEWQRELEAQPVDFLGRRMGDLIHAARARLATYLGTSADALVFVPNATSGVNAVARSLPLEPGDEIMGTNHEYGAVDRTWRFVCRQRGTRYINQPLALPIHTPEEFMEQLWAGVTERTRVISISHITSFSALKFPVEEVCRRARAAGILTVIDGAHAPGQIDLHLDTLGADFYTGNCHKWLCAPKGAGFLYARADWQHLVEPLVVSHGWESETPGASRFHDHFDWNGTHDPAAYLSIPAAIDFQAERDWPQVRAACHELAQVARDRIGLMTGLPQICPDSPDWWGQMCTIPLPPGDARELHRRLWEEFRIEIPTMTWQNQRFIRVSIQAYNGPADVEHLLAALADLLPAQTPVDAAGR
ncbi:MAG: aminotransferase class V-fold PLP-dependent enzyme [Herpetosiphonaceae bacterium]|nr:aminotransferase class V-fold PLP-dependent enzyme [Herpetosiphonaceae bacterium]